MKNTWQILTLLMATALVLLAINAVVSTPNPAVESVDTRTAVIDAIMTRSSVRSYTSEPISEADIETILRAGMAAPTAGNRQPWEFVVVTDTEILNGCADIIRAAQMARKAPLAIIVCGVPAQSFAPPLSEYWVQDCSAATENMLLAAHAMGLGAVWCGVYPNDQGDRVPQMQRLLGLPTGVYPLNVIVFGHPDKEPVVKDKWSPAKVFYNQYSAR